MVDLGGYVIILVETKDKKIKLYGSPADKADLEVGDEILEVNGKSLEDASHTEVISHIHQCIRSRTICLRVKRRTGNKLAADLAASSNVQDAFVIAVEQRAKERLERLSALKKIKPVDISKLSTQLSEPNKSSSSNNPSPTVSSRTIPSDKDDEGGGILDHSSIYVTSIPNLTSSAPICTKTSPKTRSRSSTPGGAKHQQQTTKSPSKTPSPKKYPKDRSTSNIPVTSSSKTPSPKHHSKDRISNIPVTSSSKTPSPKHHPNPNDRSKLTREASGSSIQHRSSSRRKRTGLTIQHNLEDPFDAANKSGDELELTLDNNEEDTSEEEDEDLNPLNTTGDSKDSEDDFEEDDDEELSDSAESSLPGTPEKTYGLGSERREVLLVSKKERSPLQVTSSGDSSSRKSGGSGGSSSDSSGGRDKTTKHFRHDYNDRQSEHDDNMISMVEFDPSNKEMAVDVPDTFVGRTKTPPRYPPPKVRQSPIHHNNNNNSNSSKGSKRGGSSGTVTPVNGTLPKPVAPPQIPQQMPLKQDIVMALQSPTTQEEINTIKKYEKELKLRREREEAVAELQRTSIRGSQKLQSLASYPQGTAPKPIPTGMVNEAFDQDESFTATDEDKGTSPSITELIQSLQRIQNVLNSNGHRISEDMTLVAQLLVNPDFQKVLAVHNKVQETWCLNKPPTPHSPKSQQFASDCIQVLNKAGSPEALELAELLSKFTIEGLFYAHDRIADSEPVLGESPTPVEGSEEVEEVCFSTEQQHPQSSSSELNPQVIQVATDNKAMSNYPQDNVVIVQIDKTNEPLGATIRNEGDAVIIGRIVRGGAAEKSAKLNEGDEILEVNGTEVQGKSVNEVCDMLAGMTGTLTFVIVPCNSQTTVTPTAPSMTHVKAYFDYDPEEDLYIPCRELGMGFQKGDILHVINQADPNWWQAYRDGEDDQSSLAGLIPSKTFQEQREAVRQTVVGDNAGKEKSKKAKLLCAKKHQKKKKKKMLYPNYNDEIEAEEILTYEPVDLYFPKNNRKRPIVLIGPPNIGRHELRQKLMEDRERFAAAIPHTSRPKRDRELDGQDYHFISRTQFEADILSRRFVEHGEYEKAYYGTSLNAIRSVVNSGKICVLNLHPLSLKMLKNSDLKPYVVLIAPPSLEKLRQRKIKLDEPFKEEELKEIIQKAREMEDQYGHYFDLVLINQDIERTYQQLLIDINILEREPQWVPASWR